MMMLAMLGWQELLVIAVVAVLIFGRRLPDVGRSLGQGLVEFKKGLRGVDEDVKDAVTGVKDVAEEARNAGQEDQDKQES